MFLVVEMKELGKGSVIVITIVEMKTVGVTPRKGHWTRDEDNEIQRALEELSRVDQVL